MSYLDDYKKGLEKRQANPGSTRNSTASNQGDKTVAERSDDYMGEYLRGLERRNNRPVYSSGVGQNYITNFMKRSNEILSSIKSGTYRTNMQDLQELGQQSSAIRKFLHDNPSQFPREVVRILEDRMNELDSAARSTSWAVRTDLLDEARAGMESSQGKSRYQENQEAMAEESARLRKKWEGSLNPYLYGPGGYQPNEHYNMVGQEQAEDYFDLSSMAQEKVWMDTVAKYTGKEFKDNFWGQFGANYTMGRLGQDSSIAWNKYLDDPTEQNRRDAETIDQLITEIQLNNEDTLADDGTLPWISKTLANYIPQFLDQMKYSGSLGAVGALTGNPKGVKAGIVMGSGVYSYMTMRGAAFKSLLEAGIPEEQARAAAKDEAVVSSLIEMGDTAIDLATLGGGKLINVLTAGSLDAIKNQIAKGVGKNVLTKLAAALAKYGINIGSEWLEEATQESVSIANQNNLDGGIPGLVQDAAGVFFGSVLDSESEEGQQIREAGEEGAKIAAMMGGIQGVTNAAASRFAANSRIRAAQQGQQVPEQLPPTPKEQRQNDLLQQMPEPIQRESSQADQKTDADVSEPEAPTVTLEDLSAKYGAQAGAMEQTYRIGGGEQDVTQFDRAYEVAYNMGKSGVNESYAMKSQATSYLTEGQRKEAFQAGRYAAETAAREQADRNTAEANGKTGWKKGVVKGEGVQISDLTKTFNDPQRTAYKTLSTIAEATGIDIVLYKSQTDQDGKFQGAQGKFKWDENAIYIDVNAGLSYAKDVGELSKYTMLRTFGHEFTHFVEKWNPQQYNEFRSTVLDALTEQGMNVEDLIDLKMAQDSTGKLTYDLASREVVAESMTDILQDSTFVEQLAAKNRTLFDTIRSKIKEFLADIKRYFSSLAQNPSKEARALQKQMGDTVSYLEDIVKKFDQVAVRAVEQYQATVAEDVQQEKDTETKYSAEPKITKSSEQKQESKTEKDQEKSSQPVTKQGEPAAQEVQPQEYQDDYGFTIRTNSQYGTLEISFTSKPDAAIRDALKANKFRWNGKKGVWYGKADQQAIVDALHEAYTKLEQAPVEEQNAVEPTALGDDTVQSDKQPEIQEALKPEAEQDVTEENTETEQLEPESIGYVAGIYTDNPKITEEKPSRLKSFSKKVNKSNYQGVSVNAEETGEVLPDRSDGSGASRLLANQQTGDVFGNGADRTAVADAGERGNEAGRDDNRPDAERDVGGYGEGSSPVGDLRGNDDLTEEKPQSETPAFREIVDEQIQQKSTEQPKGSNFVIGESLDLPKGDKSRYRANVEAIRLVKKLQAENRYATAEEQKVLSKYVGWGGLANAFDQKKTEWAKEYEELKELLSDEEYNQARGSTLNAHYTDISVIKAMYAGLKQLGFTGGRMLEPASGVGNFVGAMPSDMSSQVKSWTMVELDGITGLIAKYLYPNSDVRIEGFENAKIPDNYMDVAIGNVPFGNFPIYDKTYPKKVTSAIHNYFFAKSLDKVRPGGIVMFITSSYTMNSKDSTVRRYIMSKADLLGAIRLPSTAFKDNASTEVVTDILILKKRPDKTPYSGMDFLESPWTYPVKNDYRGVTINQYFNDHPEMVLGQASFSGGMYRGNSLTYQPFTDKGPLSVQIQNAFANIKEKMDYPYVRSPEKTNFQVERASKKMKQNGLAVKDGKVFQNQDGELVEVPVPKGTAERISGMLEIRDAVRDLQNFQQQGLTEDTIRKAREKLNKLYDDFVVKHGFLNSQANRTAIKNDPYRFSLFALENYNTETKKATKADIFSKNTISPNRTITSVASVSEGLIVSINQTGGVDTALISKLSGVDENSVVRELLDSRKVFKNRDGILEPAETYLSGNVRAKLRDAEALAPLDPDYQKNVEALKSVIPPTVSYDEIFVNPGTPWIPNDVYSDFAAYILGSVNTGYRKAVDVTRNPETGNFTVELIQQNLKWNALNLQKWGTNKRSFLDLYDAMLNSKSVVVRYKDADGASVIDKDATAAANEKIENIQKEFQKWLWEDETRRDELQKLYNETFNAIVTPKYDGSNLTVNGANAMKPLRPHQRDAVQRVISSGGNTLLAHKVGAGKTYEMAAAAMKLKQLGLVKKPMFVVPKSLVAQWGNEFMDFFPTAKLLVAEAGDFTKDSRKVFANRISNGEYDAVILSYEQFEKLPISDSFARELYEEQIDSVIAAIEEAKAEKGEKSLSVKDLEKKRKSLQAKIDKLTDTAKDQDNIEFEKLGVDGLFVDEAHNFKNLFYTTSMTNVAGLGNKDGSKRAFDLYTKVRYLQKLNGGRGIVFATATPVMNSMSEMYIMQKYLQPDLLDQMGLSTFDAWAKQFGEVVNGVEIKPSGQGYRVKQSFSRFKNMSELQLMFRNFADVLTDIPGLKIPKMKGGKVQVVVCDPGQFQQDYMKLLEERADKVKNVDPSVDNMLKITSDGRKISYTQRMIDPSLPYEEGCKIYRCADNVAKEYRESSKIKGTQLIFCDMATPKGKSKTETTQTDDMEIDMESVRLYEDIKARLVQKKIPAKEIAFIHEADTDAKKKKLFADVNEGKVRVLIGSTGKMGVGMNAQKRVVAIHHLDAPWRPGDVEQRNGRAFRQGNINDEVTCYTYVTEGSFDARLWDILDRKQGFINQIMNGENVGREVEDTGEVTLSAAEVKALASGSPLILEQVQLDADIKKLESLYRSHLSSISNAKAMHQIDLGRIATLSTMISSGKKDVQARTDAYQGGKFKITIGKKTYTEKKDAGTAMMTAAISKATEDGYTSIGSFAGFQIEVVKTSEGIKGNLRGNLTYQFNTYPGNTTYMINHLISIVEGLPDKVASWEESLQETKADLKEQEALMTMPFEKQGELDQKRARYAEVMEELNPKEEQKLNAAETLEQEQAREVTLSDRDILEMAANDIRMDTLTEGERDALQIFRDRLTRLNDLKEQRADLGTQYREQQFGANGQKVDRAEAEKTRERMKILDSQIAKAQTGILDVQNKEVLRKVLQKARKVVETKQREKDAVVLSRWRDRRNNAEEIQKYRKRIAEDVKSMTDWVINPSNKDIVKHIPDALKNTVIPFLTSIDFTSKRQLRGGNATKADADFIKRLEILKSSMRNRMNDDNTGMYSGYTDLPPDFMERLDSFVDSAKAITGDNDGELIINRMTASELKELSSIVRSLKKLVQDFNRFHANAMYQHVYDAANATIQELAVYHDAPSRTKVGESVNNFLFWEQIRPAYAFERFGKGGVAIYDGLRRGQAQLAFDTKEIVDFSEKAYTEKEVREWDKEVKEIHLGATVIRMKVSQIMSLYALSKRRQAFGHIVGNGIRVSTFFDKGKKVSDTGHKLAPQQIGQIIGELTPRQIEVADQLQKFMQNKGGQWGNYVSLKRFGENLFGEPNYFPINSDGRHLEATADENPSAASLYALLNMGFTKKTVENAKNRIVIYSIFDVFANHMASMAQYHSMALPVLDALKWFNYNQDGSVRDELNRVFGAPEESRPGSGKRGYAENFIVGILKAFNGTEAQGVPSDARGMNALRRFNMAQVAYNARVVLQQPLAVTRAAMILDYTSIVKGMKLSPAAIQKNIQEMNKYSGIAVWKSLGFYDTNISRGLTSIIKHDETFMDKIGEVGMIGAEKADQITWAGIWSACKEEVRRKHPEIGTSSDAYYKAVTDLFEDVVYKTQVVDSVLTKNEFLRSKGLFARLTGSFMSEPTTTASMVMDAFDKYRMDLQMGKSRTDSWRRNRKNIVRTIYVYAVGAVALAAVQAVADAFRDDDDYATFLEKWLDAFGGNLTDELMPFNKLPILSDFYDLSKELARILGFDTYGNPPQSVYMQWYDSLVKGFEILYQKINGEDTNYTWYAGAYKLLQALSGIVGLPMAAATREIVTAWNSTIGTMSPRLKVKTYDSGDMNNIKYAYLDGYLTDAEATQELLSKGLVDNENEAYWKIREWDADGEYSRYDSLYQAARNGQSIQQAMEEFTSRGYTEKEVLSKLKSQIGTWYEGGEISKQQAVDMLEKYMDMDSQSIDAAVNKWSSKVVTGIAFEDIKEEFLAGNLTASRAAEMYARYGGYSKEDAKAAVKGWQFEHEWGFSYSQRKSAYKSGQITSSELRTILMDMGGKTAEEAEQDIACYDWEMEVPGSEGISYAAIRDYHASVESYGVTKETYTQAWKIKNAAKGVDADGDGKKDAYSVVQEVFPQIAALPISAEQKDALAHCWWADSTVKEYKTW